MRDAERLVLGLRLWLRETLVLRDTLGVGAPLTPIVLLVEGVAGFEGADEDVGRIDVLTETERLTELL